MFDEDVANLPAHAHERCGYPSKFCRHRRALKRNGELHRFCEAHRRRANKNQKRWIQSKSYRAESRGGSAGSAPTTSTISTTPTTTIDHHQLAACVSSPQRCDPHAPATLHQQSLSPADTSAFAPVMDAFSYGHHGMAVSLNEQLSEFLRDLPWPPYGFEQPMATFEYHTTLHRDEKDEIMPLQMMLQL